MHPLRERAIKKQGIASYCTAHGIVLEAAFEDAAEHDSIVLVEATANQVNQYGGYIGMRPVDFMDFAQQMARRHGLDEKRLILGGDHLGPLTWQGEPEREAMKKSEELVASYVEAGFTKIHLDTSMRLADDPLDQPLTTETIARRGARLAKRALEAWEERRIEHPDASELVFVIGSEVPIPGGAHQDEEGISVTSPDSFAETVTTYKEIFAKEKLEVAWEKVIAVVVQPGVEFSDNVVFQYNSDAAAALTRRLTEFPGLVFEGHSTDYQTLESLSNMVNDGVSILKVGPELTFSLREGLLALSSLENELIPRHRRAYFRDALEEEMCRKPIYWEKYYHGSEDQKKQARIFSYSDRCRYYLGSEGVKEAIAKLCANLDSVNIPINLLHQYMPSICEGLERKEDMDSMNMLKSYLKRGTLLKYRTAANSRQV